jgi:hypothetical protein
VNGGKNKDFRVQSLVNDGCFGFIGKEGYGREENGEFVEEEGSKNDGVHELRGRVKVNNGVSEEDLVGEKGNINREDDFYFQHTVK